MVSAFRRTVIRAKSMERFTKRVLSLAASLLLLSVFEGFCECITVSAR